MIHVAIDKLDVTEGVLMAYAIAIPSVAVIVWANAHKWLNPAIPGASACSYC
jgi:hypothetical protein